jgi:hypothetical protein
MKTIAVYRWKVRRYNVNHRPRILVERMLEGEVTGDKLVSLTPEEFTFLRNKVLSAPGVGELSWKRYLESLGVEEFFIVKRKEKVK